MQISPSPSLAGIVKHYLIVESEKDMRLHYRLFSDGNPGIVFHFKDPLIQLSANNQGSSIQPGSFVYGQVTDYKDLRSNGPLGMFVVVLQPYGIHSLLPLPACELKNCTVALRDLFGHEAMDLEDEIIHSQKRDLTIATIERFLLKRIIYKNEPDPLLKESLHLIYKFAGLITMEELLKKIPITERQLERKFSQYIGTSPKKYSDIIRLHHFLKLLQGQSSTGKISDAVYESGYYDHSHMNSYFRKITGTTPLEYKIDHRLLATNFIQLSTRQ